MHPVFDKSLFSNIATSIVSRPLAALTSAIAKSPALQAAIKELTFAEVVDVEHSEIMHDAYAIDRIEATHKDLLSPAQQKALAQDPRYATADLLYVVTMSQTARTPIGERQSYVFLFDHKAMSDLMENGRTELGEKPATAKAFDVSTRGQNLLTTIPRVHRVVKHKDYSCAL